MKGIDQKLADRVDRVFHAPMQAARRSTEPAHYFQHGPLLGYAVTHLEQIPVEFTYNLRA